MTTDHPEAPQRIFFRVTASLLLIIMFVLAGGSAWRESITIDEIAHIGAGVSYVQKLELRFNPEHPPLPKVLAALPLVLRGARADYSSPLWTFSRSFYPAFAGQWIFGEQFVTRWNDPVSTLAWARFPMLILTLLLGWVVYAIARRLGGDRGGLLCLAVYVSTPVFLVFGPLVHTDIAITLFSLLALWTFADVWRSPDRKNTILFSLSFAAALLSKFTAGILLFVFVAFALSTRWRAVAGQPEAKHEARIWRRSRWRATALGVLWAAVIVYASYFILSLHQSTDSLDRIGHGMAAMTLRRLLMPPWLYFRGVIFFLAGSTRYTFLLGRSYSHGLWFYYPVVFALKSPLGFLALLVMSLVIAVLRKRARAIGSPALSPDFALHWRVLWVALLVFLGFCFASPLTISIRHFTIPIALLILFLAPLPRSIVQLLSASAPGRKLLLALVAVLAASCLLTAFRTYPYYFPYVNALSFGHPAYELLSDSNVDWNQSLPEVKRFVENHGMKKIALDDYSVDDGSAFVPEAQLWNCQQPSPADASQWVVVSANMILDVHNCGWLLHYPRQPLAGGSMYAFHLPDPIPPAGATGGPPLPSAYRQFIGLRFDVRVLFLELNRYPEKLPKNLQEARAMLASGNADAQPGVR